MMVILEKYRFMIFFAGKGLTRMEAREALY